MPGWYGAGTAFEAYATDEGRLATLHAMHESWPFFRATLNNMGMVLAKTDLAIGRRYADELVVDPSRPRRDLRDDRTRAHVGAALARVAHGIG